MVGVYRGESLMICNLFGSVVGRGLYRRCRALSVSVSGSHKSELKLDPTERKLSSARPRIPYLTLLSVSLVRQAPYTISGDQSTRLIRAATWYRRGKGRRKTEESRRKLQEIMSTRHHESKRALDQTDSHSPPRPLVTRATTVGQLVELDLYRQVHPLTRISK